MNQEMTFEVANLRKRVLRTLLRHNKLTEGKLAAMVRRSISDESWNTCVDGLLAEGLIVTARTGYGRARSVELTSLGMTEAEKVRYEVNDQVRREILSEAE